MTLYFSARRFAIEYLTPYQIARHLKWFWQRRTRGWDDRECWSLDNTLATFIAPRIEHLRDFHAGHPCGLIEKGTNENGGDDIWFAILDKISQTMRFIEKDEYWYVSNPDGDAIQEYINEGLELFSVFFQNLWD